MTLQIDLFGKFSVRTASGEPLAIAGAKTQALIAFLAMTSEMPPRRERLVAMFWGDRFPDQARQRLRQAVAKLKRIFDSAGAPDALTADVERVGLNTDTVKVDVESFFALAADTSPQTTTAAISLLKGPLLDGFYGQQAEFEDWLASERQRIAEVASRVMERGASQASQASQRGDVKTALDIARRVADLDPWSDTAQMALIRILAQKGDRAAAVQHFRTYEKTLKSELGIGPGPELLKLIDQVKGTGFFPDSAAPAADEKSAAPAPARRGRTSVAVTPFTWIAADADRGFLVDGIVEDVATKLARFSWLDVQARARARDRALDRNSDRNSASAEGIDYILHGAMRSQGHRYRLTVQLVDPTTGRYLWVERYDREAEDAFDLQNDLSDTVVGSLEAVLVRLAGHDTADVPFEESNAWDCYHRGLAIQYEFDAKTNAESQRYFRRAIELDPNFGLAYARLSYAIVISVIYFEAADVDGLLEEALVLARTAARAEPADAVARFALGRAHLARGEYTEAITQLKMSIEFNPSLAQAHCGLGDSMTYSGDIDSALVCFEEAVRISPEDPHRWAFWSYMAMAYLFCGRYADAAQWAAWAEGIPNAHYWPTAIRASALAHGGHADEAGQAVARLLELRPGITCDFVRARLFYLRDPAQVETYVSGLAKAGLP